MPATTATLQRTGPEPGAVRPRGRTGPLGKHACVRESSDTWGSLSYEKQDTCVQAPWPVGVFEQSPPLVLLQHTPAPASLETAHTCPQPQSQHTSPPRREEDARSELHSACDASPPGEGKHENKTRTMTSVWSFFPLKTIPQCYQALGSSLLKTVPTFLSRFLKYAKNNPVSQ